MKIAMLNLTKLGFSNLNNKPAILKTNNEVHQKISGLRRGRFKCPIFSLILFLLS